MLNNTKATGNLVGDPVMTETASGKKVTNFTVAVNDTIKKDGKFVKKDGSETEFYKVALWDAAAEKAANELKKGDFVKVEGELKHNKWTDKQGALHVDNTINARKFELKYAAKAKDVEQPQ